ncbi:MAG: hypothetical protein ACK542_09495 [Burkholderiales bacterium]
MLRHSAFIVFIIAFVSPEFSRWMPHKAELLGTQKNRDEPNTPPPRHAVKPCEHWSAFGRQQTCWLAEPKKPLKKDFVF